MSSRIRAVQGGRDGQSSWGGKDSQGGHGGWDGWDGRGGRSVRGGRFGQGGLLRPCNDFLVDLNWKRFLFRM